MSEKKSRSVFIPLLIVMAIVACALFAFLAPVAECSSCNGTGAIRGRNRYGVFVTDCGWCHNWRGENDRVSLFKKLIFRPNPNLAEDLAREMDKAMNESNTEE